MLSEIATTIGIKAVERLFSHFRSEDSGSIAVGLAVGYFYNFLHPVSGVIQRDELEIYANQEDKSPRKFEAEDVRIQVIIPNRLEGGVFDRCEAEFKAPHKGLIYLKEKKRFYGINYTLTEMPKRSELTIIDLARPIMSIKLYYEIILKQDTYDETSEKWLKSQIAEITAFKEALRRLQKVGFGTLVNKLDFRERS